MKQIPNYICSNCLRAVITKRFKDDYNNDISICEHCGIIEEWFGFDEEFSEKITMVGASKIWTVSE